MTPIKEKKVSWEIRAWNRFGRYDSTTGVCVGTLNMESPEYIVRFISTILAEQKKEIKEKFLELAKDHYWDSFEQDKGLVLKHLEFIVSLIK